MVRRVRLGNDSRTGATNERFLARCRDTPEWRLLGCFANACPAGRIAAASPVTYVDPQDPPMLLIVGDDDRTVPHRQTLEMADRLKAAGVPHEVIVMPGIGHNFEGKTPVQARDAKQAALAATFQFIERTMLTSSDPRRPELKR